VGETPEGAVILILFVVSKGIQWGSLGDAK